MTMSKEKLDLYARQAADLLADKIKPFMPPNGSIPILREALLNAMNFAAVMKVDVEEKAEIYDYMKQVVDVAGFRSITDALVSAKKWRAIEDACASKQLPAFPDAMWTCNGVGLFTEHQMQGYANAALALAEANKP